MSDIRTAIQNAQTCLGIELGSTRIKAVLVDTQCHTLAVGSCTWENKLVDGVWTYAMQEVWEGLQACYADLARNVRQSYGVRLERVGAMGVSAMMHGYLPLDAEGDLLVPFRTWRNTITGDAAARLSALLNFNIPQRWSVAHLYQAVLNREAHLPRIACLTTLSGYIHWKLTGARVLGVGDASGMFPIDAATHDYDAAMLARMDALLSPEGYPWKLRALLPEVRLAGEPAGMLTPEGARLLDPSGVLQPGIPFCPPEGDAGTGMVATNSVAKRTGNVSAGTSIFAMTVLERPLRGVYPEVDMVTTPAGDPVAMVHCNNCTSELDAWVSLFREAGQTLGAEPDTDTLYTRLYEKALEGEADCGGILACNYVSGEHISGFSEGRPFAARLPESRLTLANFMRAQLCAALCTLRMGMDILRTGENVALDRLTGHGGLFKVPLVGQRLLAAALDTPVLVFENAGEGGPWGMAVLAAYMLQKAPGQTLADFLSSGAFKQSACRLVQPEAEDAAGFSAYLKRYVAGLAIERAAVEALK